MALHMCTSLCVPVCTNLQRGTWATGGPVRTFTYLPGETGCDYWISWAQAERLGLAYVGRHRA